MTARDQAIERQPLVFREPALLRDVVAISFRDPARQKDAAHKTEPLMDQVMGDLVRDHGRERARVIPRGATPAHVPAMSASATKTLPVIGIVNAKARKLVGARKR